MKQETLRGELELESAFSFLIEEYGFVLAKRREPEFYGGGAIEYHSANCYVSVGLDRSSVFVLVSPTEQKLKGGYDLSTVVSYLTDGRIENVHIAYDVQFRPELPYAQLISTQATKLTVALNDYLPAICQWFSTTPAEEVISALSDYFRERIRRQAGLE